jgi:hypothetical protein
MKNESVAGRIAQLAPRKCARCFASLPARNENPLSCMRHCALRRSHFYRAKFIPKTFRDRRTIVAQIPAMALVSV